MQTFTKRFLLLVAGAAVASCCVFALTAVAKYKPYGVPDLLLDEWERKQTAIRALQSQSEHLAAGQSSQVPVAVVEQTEHDFGTLDAGVSARHVFEIRNDGNAPLAISAADTSCKCTISETSADMIPPGESAEVALVWNTGSTRQFYRQYAVIRTNDPARREIVLAVTGQIRTRLGFDVEEFVAPAIAPGEGAEASAILFSQTLDDFDIADVESGLPGMQFRVEPVPLENLESLAAKSAWRLFVSTDASLEPGMIADHVRVTIHSEQLETGDRTLVCEAPFRGRVLAPITFYGPQLHAEQGLDLGVVQKGRQSVSHVIVRVRGNYLPEQLEVSEAVPAFLHTEISPIRSRPGVFKLTVTVPEDAPQSYFNLSDERGYVAVQDPQKPDLRNWFPVRGAVIGL